MMMKILVAEDEPVSRLLLKSTLERSGYEVVIASDGAEAWERLRAEAAPQLAVIDWMMPGLDGPEVCRRVRETPETQSVYLILLTARDEKSDVVAGLAAGANDYVTKPFDQQELLARVQVGVRMIELQNSLADHIHQLEEALAQVKQLQGILPICSYCKKIRDDQNYWQRVENYISSHSEAQFSHSICPGCYDQVVRPEMDKWEARRACATETSPAEGSDSAKR